MRNVRNILRHELIGLHCVVTESKNKSNIGISGKITDETMKTIVIDGKRVPKQNTKFEINLGDKKVNIDGNFLVSRPEDRIKKKIRKRRKPTKKKERLFFQENMTRETQYFLYIRGRVDRMHKIGRPCC